LCVGFERCYAHFSTEFCRKRTAIGVIDGKPDTLLQAGSQNLVVLQQRGTDTGTV
jgi:hypothetical protein